jgi:hypothetical protein
MRFDEVELEAVPLGIEAVAVPDAVLATVPDHAPWWRRLLAVLTDLSLFAALVLALSPLLAQPLTWMSAASLAGFTIVLSYYYFVGAWLLWGKTIGGAIFDVRRALMTLRDASMRWAIGLLAVATTLAAAALGVMLS